MRVLVLAAALLVLTAHAAAAAPARPVLRCPDDTLRIATSDGDHAALPLSALAPTDTINAPTEARLWLIGGRDSLEMPLRRRPVAVTVAGAGATRVLWVRHAPPRGDAERVQLLRRFARFGGHDPAFPRIAYAPPTDSALAALRAHWNLDSVAGTGGEFDRLRRLMHWVHVTVRHDGTHDNPAAMESQALLAACAGGKATCNCRGLGTILNEVYLAMGFPSRHLTCLPWDEKDPDCHVVNMVWSSERGKWLYMDPTHDAWFADAQGQPLSPREIREAMRRGDSLQCPSPPDWNGQPMNPRVYRSYMTKNFFRFSVPAESRFGYEQHARPIRELHLDPADFQREKRGAGWLQVRDVVREWHTSDADAFWAPPGS